MNTEKRLLADLTFYQGRFQSGLVVHFGPEGTVTKVTSSEDQPADVTRLAGRALVPGFVNTHSHAFQRAIRGRTEHRTHAERDTFWTWREKMYHAATALDPEGIYDVARMAFMEMLLAGNTTVGEFHYLHHQPNGTPYANPLLLAELVRQAAASVGLHCVLLMTGYARAGWQRPPHPGQARFYTAEAERFLGYVDQLAKSGPVGVAPHSLRAVPLDYARLLHTYAQQHNLPCHMHVSEQPAENEDVLKEHGATPITVLDRAGLLDARFTAIHAVHITDAEIQLLAHASATVCSCPTTERNLGDGIVAADRLQAAGVRLAVGSDSQTQIAPLEDVRQLEYHLRLLHRERAALAPRDDLTEESLARPLWAMATVNGARSLGVNAGEIAVGNRADFVAVNLDDPSVAGGSPSSLLPSVVFGLERSAITEVWCGGNKVVAGNRHHLQDEIITRFRRVQQRLWP